MSPTPINERRRSRRRKPSQLVYLEFGRDNGGMVKDVSEDGMRFSLMGPVVVGQTLPFSVSLDSVRRIAGQAKMIWTEANGKSGGLSFAELSEQSRETLRSWLAEIDGPTAAPLPAAAAPVNAPLASPRVTSDRPPTPSALPTLAAQIPAPQTSAVQSSAIQGFATESPAAPDAVAEPPNLLIEPAPVPAASILQPPTPLAPASVASVLVAELPTTQNIPTPGSAPIAAMLSAAPPIPTEIVPIPPAKALPQTPAASPEDLRPVTREDWIRAARENPVAADRSSRSSLPPMTFTTPTPPPAQPPVPANPVSPNASPVSGNDELKSLVSTILFDKKPPEVSAKYEKIAHAVDPLREFLRQPPEEETEIAHAPSRDLATFDDENKPRGVWTVSRLILVFSFAAICGVAAAFAAIAYRQTLGQSLIQLGEKIGGQPHASVPANADASPASPSSSADSQSTLPPSDAHQPASKRASAPAANSPAAQPATARPSSPISQFRPQSIQTSAIPQPELAAGREIIPGKPRRPPEDVASLWIAVENGDTLAEVHLADHYISGDGVEKNCDQARVLLQAASKRGDELAAKRLAELSTSGCQ